MTQSKKKPENRMKLKTYLVPESLYNELDKVQKKRSINLSSYIRKRLEHLVAVSI